MFEKGRLLLLLKATKIILEVAARRIDFKRTILPLHSNDE